MVCLKLRIPKKKGDFMLHPVYPLLLNRRFQARYKQTIFQTKGLLYQLFADG